MLKKLIYKIKNIIIFRRVENRIKNLNDNDKSIRTLKRLRFLATNKSLNLIGVILFLIVFLVSNILLRFIDFICFKLKNPEKAYNFYKFLIPKQEFIFFYVIAFIFFILFYIKLRITIRASFENLEDGQKGSGRLATLNEIQSQYIAIPEKNEMFEGCGGVPISRFGDKIYIDTSPLHTIILGTTRSYKGQGFVLVTIDIYSRAKEKSSLVFNDPKGELCGQSKELLEKKGYEVKVIDFLEMLNSIGYNPLEIVKQAWKEGDFGEAELRCRTFTYALYHNAKSNEPMWENLAMSLVNSLILALCEKCIKTNEEKEKMTDEDLKHWEKEEMKVNLFSVASMLGELGGEELEEGTAIDIYFENLPSNSIAKRHYDVVKFAKGKTRSGIFISANEKLQVYLSEKVAKLTSFNDLNLEDIGFYKSDIKRVKVKILDKHRPKTDEETSVDNNINKSPTGEVKLFGVKDIICYKDDVFSKELLMNGVSAIGVKGQDLTNKIKINSSRVMWGTEGEYEIEYSVCDEENSKPIALFLIVPDFDKSNHVLATTCISQITYMLSRRASLSETGSTDREVVFLLDEAGNMSPIENFAETLTVCLGRGLKFIPVVQSFSQLKEMYGENYKTLVDNCANTIYIMSTDVDTTEEISKMTGEKTIVVNQRNGGVLSFNKNITETLEQVPVVRYDDLMRLKIGENLVIRPMYRKDLKGNKTVPYPILNTDEMRMKFKYEYLADVFSKNLSMRNIYIKNDFYKYKLEDLKVNFNDELSELIKQKKYRDIEESVRKELLKEKVKKEMQNEMKEGQVPISANNIEEDKQIRKKVKIRVIDMLSGLLKQSELDVLNSINSEKDFNSYLKNLNEDGKIDDLNFKKVKSVLK